jgi:putative thioredoxin
MESPLVFSATARNFESVVMERSLTVPVLIDFFADWCDPCKQLARVLDTVLGEFDGGFVVAKVDSEREAQLSQAFQVQSIPYCVLVKDGRPLDAFSGALTEDQVRAFLAKHGVESAAAAAAPPEEVDPNSPEARLGAARQAAIAGDVAGVRAALAGFPEESALVGDRDNLLGGLAFLEADWSREGEAATQLHTARERFLSGRWDDALRAIVESARADRAYGGGLARQAMLLVQGTLGPTESVDEFRRQLATLLY